MGEARGEEVGVDRGVDRGVGAGGARVEGGVVEVEVEHRVRAGESLSRIGRLYGVAWREIAVANGIGAPWVIRVGETVVVPGVRRERRGPGEEEEQEVGERRGYELRVLPAVRNRHRDGRRRLRLIVLHDPGVTARVAALLAALRSTRREVSYHRLLSDEARPVVYEMVPRGEVAWHAGVKTRIPGTGVVNGAVNRDSWALAVMHPMPEGHWPVLVEVLSDMVVEAGLPDAGVILGHREVSTEEGRRTDPRGIDLERLRGAVGEELGRRGWG